MSPLSNNALFVDVIELVLSDKGLNKCKIFKDNLL